MTISSLTQIHAALKANSYISNDFDPAAIQSTYLAKTWTWIKKLFGFALPYKICNVAKAILEKIKLLPLHHLSLQNEEEVELLSLLSKKVEHSKDKIASTLQSDISNLSLSRKMEQEAYLRGKRAFLSMTKNNQTLKQVGLAIRTACYLSTDRKLLRAAVMLNGLALGYANKELLKDEELVLVAVAQNGRALGHADPKLRADREVVLVAVKKDGYALKFASKELQNDKAVVLAAVKQWGLALEYASLEMKKDKDVVLAAAGQCGDAFEYASLELKKDKAIVLAAVSQSTLAYKHIDSLLQFDKSVVAVMESHITPLSLEL